MQAAVLLNPCTACFRPGPAAQAAARAGRALAGRTPASRSVGAGERAECVACKATLRSAAGAAASVPRRACALCSLPTLFTPAGMFSHLAIHLQAARHAMPSERAGAAAGCRRCSGTRPLRR